tara:strand:- start:3169 stop:4044 length:876 start_codon:yes stop_codon:yes gene_type:complete
MNTLEVLPSQYHSALGLDRGDIFNPDSYLSKSTIWELYQSSLFKWRNYPRQFKPTPAMSWGSLVDCLVTSPDDFENQFVMSPFDSFRTKEAKQWKEDCTQDIVTVDMVAKAKGAAAILTGGHKVAAEIIERSQTQVVLLNKIQHPASEKTVNMKALLDFAPEGVDYLADLKTCHDFTANGFEKAIGNYGYHVQAAHYLSMWNMQHPDDQRDRFLIIWQDSAAPYEVAVTEIPGADIADGADLFNHLLGRIVRAADKDDWPMQYTKPILLGRAAYAAINEGIEMDGYSTVNS